MSLNRNPIATPKESPSTGEVLVNTLARFPPGSQQHHGFVALVVALRDTSRGPAGLGGREGSPHEDLNGNEQSLKKMP